MEKLRLLYRKDKTAIAFDWHCLCVKFGQSRHRPFITGKNGPDFRNQSGRRWQLYQAGAEDTARMHKLISDTVLRLSKSIPEFSYFLYDYNFNDLKGRPLEGSGGTSHCCLWLPEFMRFEREGVNGIEWVNNVLKGKTTQIGKNLLI